MSLVGGIVICILFLSLTRFAIGDNYANPRRSRRFAQLSRFLPVNRVFRLGSRDGAVVKALATSSISARCHTSCLAPRVFLRVLRFSSFNQNQHRSLNSNSTRIEDPHDNQLMLMWPPVYML